MTTPLAEHLRRRRESLNEALGGEWSLRRTAERLGVSATFLSKLERGEKRPTDEMLGKLAEVLKEDPSVLTALAARVPKDVEEALASRAALVDLVRAAAGLPDEEIERRVKALREGDW